MKLTEEQERIVYHVFADGVDEFFSDEAEARVLYEELCKSHMNVRLWSMIDNGEDLIDGDCLASQGEFPV